MLRFCYPLMVLSLPLYITNVLTKCLKMSFDALCYFTIFVYIFLPFIGFLSFFNDLTIVWGKRKVYLSVVLWLPKRATNGRPYTSLIIVFCFILSIFLGWNFLCFMVLYYHKASVKTHIFKSSTKRNSCMSSFFVCLLVRWLYQNYDCS